MNVMMVSVVTTASMVPTVSATILTAATIAHMLTDITQPNHANFVYADIEKCADGTHN